MRPKKAETAVQCPVCHMLVFAGFSSHGNLIYIYIYIYIYIDIERERVCVWWKMLVVPSQVYIRSRASIKWMMWLKRENIQEDHKRHQLNESDIQWWSRIFINQGDDTGNFAWSCSNKTY